MKALLRIRPFRRLLTGWTVGNFADSVLFLTLAVWVKDLTGSSSAAAMVFLALALPVLLAPVIGLITDRSSRLRILIIGNAAAALVTLSLLFVQAPRDVWLIYVVTFGYGTLGYLNGAAQGGLVRDIVPLEHLGAANSVLITIDQGFRIITPVIGAGLYVLWGGHALAAVVAGMLLLSSILLMLVRATESPIEPSAEGGWAQITAGLRHLHSIPLLWRMTLTGAVAFGVVGFFDTALFELVEKGLGMDPAFFGVLMGIQGAGSIVGGVTAGWLLRRLSPAAAQGMGLGIVGLAALLMTVDYLGIVLLPFAVIGVFCAGVGIPWMVVATMTTRQRATPARLQGRVGAAMNVAMTVPQLISLATGAALALILDYRILIIAAGVIMLGCAVSLMISKLPTPPDAEPSTDPVVANSGEVLVESAGATREDKSPTEVSNAP